MRRIFQRLLLPIYDEAIALALPRFTIMAGKHDSGGWRIARAHEMRVAGDLFFYVLLLYYKYDYFSVDVAWNTVRGIPAGTEDEDTFREIRELVSGRRQLSKLYSHYEHEYNANLDLAELRTGPDGKILSTEAKRFLNTDFPQERYEAKMRAGVDDAVGKIGRHAVPYCHRVAARFGHAAAIPFVAPFLPSGVSRTSS